MATQQTCPTCGDVFSSKRGVINHHNSHTRPYFDADIEQQFGVPAGWLLFTLYDTLDKSTRELAEHLDYSKPVITKHLKRHGIKIDKSNREKPVHFGTYRNTGGFAYERWEHNMKWGKKKVYVHRLMAVAKYGYDSVCESDVHHKNEITWDNRPENIELMEHGEHRSYHENADD